MYASPSCALLSLASFAVCVLACAFFLPLSPSLWSLSARITRTAPLRTLPQAFQYERYNGQRSHGVAHGIKVSRGSVFVELASRTHTTRSPPPPPN
jgi:hypothetical protein